MIIDAGHRRWFVGTVVSAAAALGLFYWCNLNSIAGVTGGTTAGLWFGVAGTAMMLFCGALVLLRLVPSWWWLGSRKAWLKAHIWLGLLGVVLIMCHSGFRIGGLMGQSLWLTLAIVVLSGVFGLVLQQTLPGLLTRKIPGEASYEQINHYCGVLRNRADDLCDALHTALPSSETDLDPAGRFYDAYEKQLRQFLKAPPQAIPFPDEPATRAWFDRLRETIRLAPYASADAEIEQLLDDIRIRLDPTKLKELGPRLDKLKSTVGRLLDSEDTVGLPQAAKSTFNELNAIAIGSENSVAGIERRCSAVWLDAIEELCIQRGRLRVQERIHGWLHGWLLLHVPFSAALLVLTIVHAVMSLYY